MYPHLFAPYRLGNLELKNRLTMAPLYLGYAGEGGTVSPLMLEHYRLMAASGVALVVVENATIDFTQGSVTKRTLRADTDANLEGLARLAAVIKAEGALASLQINHAGRFAAAAPKPVSPSQLEAFGRMPKVLSKEEIGDIVGKFAAAALRVKQAGFDLVELHGGTGYLLAQFVSPRTNRRQDEYGGELANRQKFPLEAVTAVKAAVGDFPVGYRFLADEWLPDGFNLTDSRPFARSLAAAGVAYLSVMGGTYESFFRPEIVEKSSRPGYMVYLAAAVKEVVDVPVITAGRISDGALAERILVSGRADLIGLARVLWADPEWPRKVRGGREHDVIHCDADCDTCMQLVMRGNPAYCVHWASEKRRGLKAMFT